MPYLIINTNRNEYKLFSNIKVLAESLDINENYLYNVFSRKKEKTIKVNNNLIIKINMETEVIKQVVEKSLGTKRVVTEKDNFFNHKYYENRCAEVIDKIEAIKNIRNSDTEQLAGYIIKDISSTLEYDREHTYKVEAIEEVDRLIRLAINELKHAFGKLNESILTSGEPTVSVSACNEVQLYMEVACTFIIKGFTLYFEEYQR